VRRVRPHRVQCKQHARDAVVADVRRLALSVEHSWWAAPAGTGGRVIHSGGAIITELVPTRRSEQHCASGAGAEPQQRARQ